MAIPERLVTQTKRLQTSVGLQARNTVNAVLPDLSTLGQQEAGGVIRQVAVGTSTQFGNVATQTARLSYDSMREAALTGVRNAGTYSAVGALFNAQTGTQGLIGASMGLFQQGRFYDVGVFLSAGVDRYVSNVFRDTIVTNSLTDRQAVGYQRVASPTACAFCAVVALNEYTTFEESGGYHNDCRCGTVPIFKDQDAYRPDYYETFQQDYFDGRANAESGSAEDILAAIRANTDRS